MPEGGVADPYGQLIAVTAAPERAVEFGIDESAGGAVVLADGFSCRTQVDQGTDRSALHLAEVLRRALR